MIDYKCKCRKRSFIGFAAVSIVALFGTKIYLDLKRKLSAEKRLSKKHFDMMVFCNEWIRLKQHGRSMTEYFIKNEYKNIAIYGMSYLGESLAGELEGSGITVKYGIDRNATNITADFEIVTPDEKLDPVDVVVVTSLDTFDAIEEDLSSRISCPVVSLEDIICYV